MTPELKAELRAEYVMGYVNDEGERKYMGRESMAKKYGVSVASLGNLIRKDGWVKARLDHQDEFHRQLSIERAKVTARKYAKAEDSVMDAAVKSSKGSNMLLDDMLECRTEETVQLAERGVNMAMKAFDRARLAVGKASEITAVETPNDPEIQSALNSFRIAEPTTTGNGQGTGKDDKSGTNSGVPSNDAGKGSGSTGD